MEAAGGQGFGQGLAILYDTAGVSLEFRTKRLAETDRLGGDDVFERAALHTREDRLVQLLGVLFPAEHQTAARTAQGFVGGGGYEIGIRNRAGVGSARHQTGDVGHIHHQVRAHLVRDGSETGKVNGTGIGAGPGENQFRLALIGKLFDGIVIQHLGLRGDRVRNDVVKFA